MSIDKYKKKKTRDDKVTSVSISREQYSFIRKHRINLSWLVRDAIERLKKEGSK